MNERFQRSAAEPLEERRVSTPVLIGGAAIAAILIAVAIWYFVLRDPAPAEPEPVPAENTTTPAPAPEPATRPPPTAAPAPQIPLPPLASSDAEVSAAFSESFGQQAVSQYLNSGDIIRKLVVTIDSLGRPTLPLDKRVVAATPGLFVVAGPEDARYLSEDNYARYSPFVTQLTRADASTLVAIYRRYYPLLQEAYLELGYPDTNFETRVIEVIDHLLDTPNVAAPVDLTQPKVLYEYRDPVLEDRSSGQKILMRIGPEHATLVKAKLREIRALLTQ
jgi:hypothetical protein